MCDVQRITVSFPCCLTAREFHDASSASKHTREGVSHLTLATLAPVITAKADFVSVRLALAKEDKEGSGVRCFNFHGLVVVQVTVVKYYSASSS